MIIEFPTVSFISALIVLIPLPWHWRTRNICTSSIMLWLAMSNIYRGINAILWAHTVVVKYKIWCDIVVRINIGSGVGVPASVMCIGRRLAQAASPDYKAPSSREKSQRMRFEVGMCVVLPIIFMMLHIVVQPSRFLIIEGIGCDATYYPFILSLFIIQIPPVLFSWAGAVYAGITLRSLIHHRIQLQQASPHTHPPASSRYLRLIILAVTMMTFATVMSLFLLVTAIDPSFRLWASWDDVHTNWREVEQISEEEFPEVNSAATKLGWYFIPIASVTVFSYFGFDDRILPEYKSMFAWIKARVFRIKPAEVVVLPLSANGTVLTEIGLETVDAVACEARNANVSLSDFPALNPLA